MSSYVRNNIFHSLEKKQLINFKTKAVRYGLWFKRLSRIDRVLFDLTIRVVRNIIKSEKLAKSLLILVGKLENTMKDSPLRSLKEIGLPLAQKISFTAQKLGNFSAKKWACDSLLAIFLAVLQVNTDTFT